MRGCNVRYSAEAVGFDSANGFVHVPEDPIRAGRMKYPRWLGCTKYGSTCLRHYRSAFICVRRRPWVVTDPSCCHGLLAMMRSSVRRARALRALAP
jgi:hypothetical protein